MKVRQTLYKRGHCDEWRDHCGGGLGVREDHAQVRRQLGHVGTHSQSQGSAWMSLCGDWLKGTSWVRRTLSKAIPVAGGPGRLGLPWGWREMSPSRYWGWGVLVKLADRDSCQNCAVQGALCRSQAWLRKTSGGPEVSSVNEKIFLMLSAAAPGSLSWGVFSSPCSPALPLPSPCPPLPPLPLPPPPIPPPSPLLRRGSSKSPPLHSWLLGLCFTAKSWGGKYSSVDFKGLLCMSHEQI